jgi:hypothetical protein
MGAFFVKHKACFRCFLDDQRSDDIVEFVFLEMNRPAAPEPLSRRTKTSFFLFSYYILPLILPKNHCHVGRKSHFTLFRTTYFEYTLEFLHKIK